MLLPSDSAPERTAAAAQSDSFTTRDHLAADRTTMANERTFLAYVRTSLALILTGASAAHLPGLHPRLAFGASVYYGIGAAFALAGFAALGVGYVRYRRFHKQIQEAGSISRELHS